MKLLLALTSATGLIAAACTPTASSIESSAPPVVGASTPEPPPLATDVACEVVSVQATAEGFATAKFRATNRGKSSVEYSGYSPDSPVFTREKLADGRWQEEPLGWCGTGLQDLSLAPGESVELQIGFERDGQSYRFKIGNPAIVTPPVSSQPD